MTYDKKGYFNKSTKALIYNNQENLNYEKYKSDYGTDLFLNSKRLNSSKIDLNYLYNYGPMKK